MPDQERKTARREPKRDSDTAVNPAAVEKGKELRKDLDNLVDEIDRALEDNAEGFAKNYIQRRGRMTQSGS